MLSLRRAEDRGHRDHGWLDTYHTFSFADYYEPEQMGFRLLRVLNDDTVAPGRGFGTHGHRDMEIVSYVLEGSLEHQDSMGTGSVLRYGDVQRMTAGRGVTHSEFNHSRTEPLRFLQIWILPERDGLAPEYEEKHFTPEDKASGLRLIVSPDGREGSLRIHQDVAIYSSILEAEDERRLPLGAGRHVWLQVASGELDANGIALRRGDGLAVSNEREIHLAGRGRSEVLLFDLP